jgi:4-amino-4-deoxy-L-arabinose transferase-like glycosyltransferase
MMINTADKMVLWVLTGVLLLRVAGLYFAQTDLFFDEAQYWAWSRSLEFGYFSKPPVLAWIIRVVTEVCGTSSEFCIRLASPVIHTATALVIFAIARQLYNARTGLWSAIVFITLPGISLSSGIASTDVPLLFFWSVALLALVKFTRGYSWWHAILLGVAIGAGLMSKYAMIYFLLCLGVYMWIEPTVRQKMQWHKLAVAVAVATLLLAPNIWWNLQNGLVTFSHTAANANWGKSFVHPLKALEFFAAQFGVFGPILFGAILVISVRYFHSGISDNARLLLAFSMPIILLITMQGFLSRAHANWAATAYIAATILVVATMLQDKAIRWFKGSLLVHAIVAVILLAGPVIAPKIKFLGTPIIYERLLGWQRFANFLQRQYLDPFPFAAVVTDRRVLSAQLTYYLRNSGVPVVALKAGKTPRDYFQMTSPLMSASGEPVLYVSLRDNPSAVAGIYANISPTGQYLAGGRTIYVYRLSERIGKL